jgi:long-chain acyl-CoA synthetase
VVNVNPLYTPRELQHQLVDSGAEAIIVLENFATTVQQVVAHTGQARDRGHHGRPAGRLQGRDGQLRGAQVKKMVPAYSLPQACLQAVLAEGARLTLQPVKQGHDDIAFLQYTGGTTGVSKGAILLHRNIIANVLQNEAWLQLKQRNQQWCSSARCRCTTSIR